MTENECTVRAGMRVCFDTPITMPDGVVLRADVYRPDTDARVPVIMTMGPYGKARRFQDGPYAPRWQALIAEHQSPAPITGPLDHDLDLIGPLAARLQVSTTAADADLFLTLRAFAPDGTEVTVIGSVAAAQALSNGWLRLSHRKIDAQRSLPYRPWHTHDERLPVQPGQVYPVDVEIWPTGMHLPAGYRLALTIGGSDFTRPEQPGSPVTLFFHTDETDRPTQTFAGVTTLHVGPGRDNFLLTPLLLLVLCGCRRFAGSTGTNMSRPRLSSVSRFAVSEQRRCRSLATAPSTELFSCCIVRSRRPTRPTLACRRTRCTRRAPRFGQSHKSRRCAHVQEAASNRARRRGIARADHRHRATP